jgi:hypothetical protein
MDFCLRRGFKAPVILGGALVGFSDHSAVVSSLVDALQGPVVQDAVELFAKMSTSVFISNKNHFLALNDATGSMIVILDALAREAEHAGCADMLAPMMLDFVESCSHRCHRTPFVRVVRQEMEVIGASNLSLQERARMFTELLSQRIPRRRRLDFPSSKWEITASPAFILVMIEGDCECVTFPRLVSVHCVRATALYEFAACVVSTDNGAHYRVIIRKGDSEFAEINDGVVSDGRSRWKELTPCR